MARYASESANPVGTLRRMRASRSRAQTSVASSGLTRMSMAVRSTAGRAPQKIVAQSPFMLTTVQPCSAAAAIDLSAPVV
jgi:hypothetical protein